MTFCLYAKSSVSSLASVDYLLLSSELKFAAASARPVSFATFSQVTTKEYFLQCFSCQNVYCTCCCILCSCCLSKCTRLAKHLQLAVQVVALLQIN